MNKKTKQSLVAGLAAVMGTGIVAPVVNAATQTLPAQYEEAFKATEKAVNSKNQKEMTQARVLVDALYEKVKGTKEEYLATTLSAMLDPVQQAKLNELFAGAEKADKSLSQADINTIRNLVVDMPEVWKKPYSSNLVDPIQQKLITKAVEATKKATDSKLQADKDVAQALLTDIKTATNNDGVVAWANGYQSEIDKIVVKLEVNGAAAVNSTTVTLSGAGLAQLKVEDVTIEDNLIKGIAVSADQKSATITLDSKMAPDRELVLTAKVGEETKTFKIKYQYSQVTNVSLNEGTFDDDRAGQKLTFKLNGQTVDADSDYVKLAGYTVNFVAVDAVTGAPVNIFAASTAPTLDQSTTGVLAVDTITNPIKGNYKVQVQLIKNGLVSLSATGNINIANLDANVTAIDTVKFVNAGRVAAATPTTPAVSGPAASYRQGTTATAAYVLAGPQYTMNSNYLVVGERASVGNVVTILNGAKSSSLVAPTVTSSNPAVISVDAAGVMTANLPGTATITVKVGNQTKTFTFTVTNTERKLSKLTTSGAIKGIVGVAQDIRFKTFDQYNDPCAATATDIIETAAKNAAGTVMFVAPQVVTDAVNSVGVVDLQITGTVAGQGTAFFQDAKGNTIGSVYTDFTIDNSVKKTDFEIVSNPYDPTKSQDTTLDLGADVAVDYSYNNYNATGIYVSSETIDGSVGVSPANPAGGYSVVSSDPTIATVAFPNATTARVTALKVGTVDIQLKRNNVVVKTVRITVTDTRLGIAATGVSFKAVPNVTTIKNVNLNDLLTVETSDRDDVVKGIALNKTLDSNIKVRIVEAATTLNGNAVPANTLYVDYNNDGLCNNRDVILGLLSAEAVTGSTVNGVTHTNPLQLSAIYATAPIYTSFANDEGTIIVKLTNPAGTIVGSTSFAMKVK